MPEAILPTNRMVISLGLHHLWLRCRCSRKRPQRNNHHPWLTNKLFPRPYLYCTSKIRLRCVTRSFILCRNFLNPRRLQPILILKMHLIPTQSTILPRLRQPWQRLHSSKVCIRRHWMLRCPVSSMKTGTKSPTSTLTTTPFTTSISRRAHVSFKVRQFFLCCFSFSFSDALFSLAADAELSDPEHPQLAADGLPEDSVAFDVGTTSQLQKSELKRGYTKQNDSKKVGQKEGMSASSSKNDALFNKKRTFSLRECALF
jgi:hypothetical protein